jgi:hypothetical protein
LSGTWTGKIDFIQQRKILISLHSSRIRALRYGSTQREQLWFDGSYQDPDVWTFQVNTTGLEWRTMPLTGSHLAKSIRVLTDFQSGVYVFSTKEAIRCFGAASQWLCEDEWFALANVPRHLIVQSWQWMDGVLPCGRPYKLATIAPHRIPRDLVMIPSLDVFSLLIDREQPSEEEQDCWHAAAMRREHPSDEEQDSWHAEAMRREMITRGID